MPEMTSGEAQQIATERIAREAIEKTGSLDLSDLPLEKFPAELATLTHLVKLNCSFSRIADLSPLASLAGLQSLNFSVTRVVDLSPLAGLSKLQRLYCGGTRVADLSPLAGLTGLQMLDCSDTHVEDLEWLLQAKSQPKIVANSLKLRRFSSDIALQSRVSGLALYETTIEEVPVEVLSRSYDEDCLPRLRAYLEDAQQGTDPIIGIVMIPFGTLGRFAGLTC